MGVTVEDMGQAVLYLADCAEVLAGLPAHSACVTDPPYGLNDKWVGGGGNWRFDPAEIRAWDGAVNNILYDALEKCEHGIVWGGNFYSLPPSRGWLVWDKIVRRFSTSHCELAWTSLDQPVKAFNLAHGTFHANEGKVHPTQKPLALMKWCIGQLPTGAESVLDPFMGSGSTGVAAVALGKTFTGIEREQRYFDIARRRMEAALSQPDLYYQFDASAAGKR